MRSRSFLPFLAAAATVVLIGAVASAHHSDLTDPNDTDGTLDVHTVQLDHVGNPPTWTVITFSRWRTKAIWDRGDVLVFLDTMGDDRADYYVLVHSVGSELRAALWWISRDATKPDRRVSSIEVWRKAGDSVSVSVPLKRLTFGGYRTFYRWSVVTTFTGAKCPRTCIDHVPDEGSIEQWRPGMSPEPSPSPSP